MSTFAMPRSYSEPDDESATVMTGFNTDEHFENRSMLLDEKEEREASILS